MRESLSREEKEMYEKYKTKIVPGTTNFSDENFETKVRENSTDINERPRRLSQDSDLEMDTDNGAGGSSKRGNKSSFTSYFLF